MFYNPSYLVLAIIFLGIALAIQIGYLHTHMTSHLLLQVMQQSEQKSSNNYQKLTLLLSHVAVVALFQVLHTQLSI